MSNEKDTTSDKEVCHFCGGDLELTALFDWKCVECGCEFDDDMVCTFAPSYLSQPVGV
jgi:tRNA(Ile2) C34 agmatinyltransferase TiaS